MRLNEPRKRNAGVKSGVPFGERFVLPNDCARDCGTPAFTVLFLNDKVR